MMTTREDEASPPALLEPGQTFGVIGTGVMGQTLLKGLDRKSTRLNSSHIQKSRMPSSA